MNTYYNNEIIALLSNTYNTSTKLMTWMWMLFFLINLWALLNLQCLTHSCPCAQRINSCTFYCCRCFYCTAFLNDDFVFYCTEYRFGKNFHGKTTCVLGESADRAIQRKTIRRRKTNNLRFEFLPLFLVTKCDKVIKCYTSS